MTGHPRYSEAVGDAALGCGGSPGTCTWRRLDVDDSASPQLIAASIQAARTIDRRICTPPPSLRADLCQRACSLGAFANGRPVWMTATAAAPTQGAFPSFAANHWVVVRAVGDPRIIRSDWKELRALRPSMLVKLDRWTPNSTHWAESASTYAIGMTPASSSQHVAIALRARPPRAAPL